MKSISGESMPEFKIAHSKRLTEQLYDQARSTWGVTAQDIATIEELNECAMAIAQGLNDKASLDDVLYEIVDVQIMLGQYLRNHNVDPDALRVFRDEKLRKLNSNLGDPCGIEDEVKICEAG